MAFELMAKWHLCLCCSGLFKKYLKLCSSICVKQHYSKDFCYLYISQCFKAPVR